MELINRRVSTTFNGNVEHLISTTMTAVTIIKHWNQTVNKKKGEPLRYLLFPFVREFKCVRYMEFSWRCACVFTSSTQRTWNARHICRYMLPKLIVSTMTKRTRLKLGPNGVLIKCISLLTTILIIWANNDRAFSSTTEVDTNPMVVVRIAPT